LFPRGHAADLFWPRSRQGMGHYLDELRRLEALIYSGRRPKLTGLPRGARGDWTDVVDRYDELCKAYHDELSELFRVKSEVNGVISRVEDPKLRELLVLRYCRYFSWDRIASTMGYEPRWIHALHARALRCVDHILDQ